MTPNPVATAVTVEYKITVVTFIMTASSLFMAPILLTEQWVIRTARDDKHHSKRGTLSRDILSQVFPPSAKPTNSYRQAWCAYFIKSQPATS
jgi:hypothetical protein